MRAKIFGAFVTGLAFGALAITLVLWLSGSLQTARVSAGSVTPAAAPAPPSIVELPVDLPLTARALTPTATPEAAIPDAAYQDAPRLAMPISDVDPATVSDTFDANRDGRKHEALDLMAPRGTPVRAVAEGNVVKLFTSKPGGLTVYQFDDSQKWCFYYAHLDHYASGLKEGTLLRVGDVLGFVGSTGNASAEAPHLHFAVNRLGPDKKWWEGTPIDPLPLLRK